MHQTRRVLFTTKSDYDGVKKVYSIWICVNPDKKVENTTVEYSMEQKNLVGVFPDDRRYDLLSVILVCLSEQLACETDEYRLHRLLEAVNLIRDKKYR